jgi:distribution and morphology protein 34
MEAMTDPNIYSTAGSIAAPTATKTHLDSPATAASSTSQLHPRNTAAGSMSFLFSWNFFDKELLYERARIVLKETMNKTKKPAIIVGDMDVESFDFGTVPPRLEILEIGDIGIDRFRGIFKVDYEGDASLTLRTRIEVNGLTVS